VKSKSLYILPAFVALLYLYYATPTERLAIVNPEWHPPTAATTSAKPAIFTDETLTANIYNAHQQSSSKLAGLHDTLGSGACTFDYDDDGWTDLLIITGSGFRHYYGQHEWWDNRKSIVLYKNLGDNKFLDVTEKAGLSRLDIWGMGCIAADLNNNGYPDLYLSNYGSNILLKNNGNGTFSNATKASGISGESWSTSSTVADFNNDGLLDIYTANYISYRTGAMTYERSTGVTTATSAEFDPSLYDSQGNVLYLNVGNLSFEPQAEITGVSDPSGRSLATTWLDLNADGYPDLFVSNDKPSPNKLFLNNGDTTFTDVSSDYGISNINKTTGVLTADLTGNLVDEIVLATDRDSTNIVYAVSDTVRDIARDSGLDTGALVNSVSWGISQADYNSDGHVDLYYANGYATPEINSPLMTQGQENSLMLNNGSGAFIPCKNVCFGKYTDSLASRTAINADFNNDGAIDLYVSQNNDLGQLLINQTIPKTWVGLHLIGTNPVNRDAIGARVVLRTKKRSYQKTVQTTAFLGSHDKRIVFPIVKDDVPETLNIHWNASSSTAVKNIPINRYAIIQQNTDTEPQAPTTTIDSALADKTLRSRLRFSNPDYRVSAIHWLLENNHESLAVDEFTILYAETKFDTLHTGLDILLESLPLEHTLPVINIGLSSNYQDIRKKMISILSKKEFEPTYRWLLHGLSDDDPEVVCSTVDAFGFFYREEEAMLKSKFLALPFLLKLLEHENKSIRQCTTKTLAHSEHHSAVDALIATIAVDNPETVINTIDALGDIRELRAYPPLTKILLDSESSATVKAHSLAALTKIAPARTAELLDRILAKSYDEDPSTTFDNTLRSLLSVLTGGQLATATVTRQVQRSILNFSDQPQVVLNAEQNDLVSKILSYQPNLFIEGIVQYRDVESTKRPTERPATNHGGQSLNTLRALQRILTDPSEPMQKRTAVLKNKRIERLMTTKKILREIARSTVDPLQKTAIAHLLEKFSDTELDHFVSLLKNEETSEDVRYAIANTLIGINPQLTIRAITF